MLAVCLGLIGGGVAGVVWWLKNTELPGDGLPAIVDHTSAPPAPGPEFDTPSAHMFNRIVQEFSALPLEEAAGPAPSAQCRDLSTDPRPEGTRHMCAIQEREGRSITYLVRLSRRLEQLWLHCGSSGRKGRFFGCAAAYLRE